MKVLVVLGHPRSPSLCAALAEAYTEGALAAGLEVAALDLGALQFDPDVHSVSPRDQALEPDLERAVELIGWADHLVFVYPAWWGVGPARLKGFLDRVLLPGFAFREQDDGRFEGLLRGKTAHLVTTLDMPPWVYRLIHRAPGHNAMKRSALGFCGIDTAAILALGPVKDSTQARRAAWLEQARQLGFSLSAGPHSRVSRMLAKAIAWGRALRLRFYAMSWLAYTLGAVGALALGASYDAGIYWLGYLFLFCAEAATVFINEVFDFDSDRRNPHFGPFNGGSRVLVDKRLSFRELGIGIGAALLAAMACAGLLLDAATNSVAMLALLLGILLLGAGYTAPPLKLSWRGLGEITVGLMHSLVPLLFGHVLQDGAWLQPLPWLLSLPLFFAVLPSIMLAGLPDRAADEAAGKLTLAVRWGLRKTALLAMAPTILAALLVLGLKDLPALHGAFDGLLPWIVPHAALLLFLLWRYAQQPVAGRIDLLIIAALTYLVWFGLVPLLQLVW